MRKRWNNWNFIELNYYIWGGHTTSRSPWTASVSCPSLTAIVYICSSQYIPTSKNVCGSGVWGEVGVAMKWHTLMLPEGKLIYLLDCGTTASSFVLIWGTLWSDISWIVKEVGKMYEDQRFVEWVFIEIPINILALL